MRCTLGTMLIAAMTGFAGLGALPALADDHGQGGHGAAGIAVSGAWARTTPPVVSNGAAYMTLSNGGASADRLVSAETGVAGRVEFHEHVMENGVAIMGEVESVELPAGAEAVFEPGGRHIMLMGLDGPLAAGERFTMTLTFERAGEITVDVPVHRERPEHAHSGDRPEMGASHDH